MLNLKFQLKMETLGTGLPTAAPTPGRSEKGRDQEGGRPRRHLQAKVLDQQQRLRVRRQRSQDEKRPNRVDLLTMRLQVPDQCLDDLPHYHVALRTWVRGRHNSPKVMSSRISF
jgi:hypothetical protein